MSAPVWEVRPRRYGTVHVVRSWAVCRDGVEIDLYASRDLADAHVNYVRARAVPS